MIDSQSEGVILKDSANQISFLNWVLELFLHGLNINTEPPPFFEKIDSQAGELGYWSRFPISDLNKQPDNTNTPQ